MCFVRVSSMCVTSPSPIGTYTTHTTLVHQIMGFRKRTTIQFSNAPSIHFGTKVCDRATIFLGDQFFALNGTLLGRKHYLPWQGHSAHITSVQLGPKSTKIPHFSNNFGRDLNQTNRTERRCTERLGDVVSWCFQIQTHYTTLHQTPSLLRDYSFSAVVWIVQTLSPHRSLPPQRHQRAVYVHVFV